MKTKTIDTLNGIVIKKNMGQYWVSTQGETIRCGLRLPAEPPRGNGKRGKKEHKNAIDIVVGDRVTVQQNNDKALICALHPRINRLARRAAKARPGAQSAEQVIAANIDQLVAVMALTRPEPRWNLLDRYLVSAESLEIEALVCLTKLDDAGSSGLDVDVQQEIENYQQAGYRVLLTSAHTGEGIPALEETLNGKVSVLMGKSGAGKSSLLNTLLPGLALRVNEVNETTGKGRHTTTGAEMYACGSGMAGWSIQPVRGSLACGT